MLESGQYPEPVEQGTYLGIALTVIFDHASITVRMARFDSTCSHPSQDLEGVLAIASIMAGNDWSMLLGGYCSAVGF